MTGHEELHDEVPVTVVLGVLKNDLREMKVHSISVPGGGAVNHILVYSRMT
jgi:hypothetical protein